MERIAIADELEAVRGSYAPNRFIIYIAEDTPFFFLESEDVARQNNNHLNTFLHEYWHYWLNVSTPAGFKSFSFTQNYIADFTYSLVTCANGESTGSADIPDDCKERVTNLLSLHKHHQGNSGPSDFRNITEFAISAVTPKTNTVTLNGKPAPDPYAELSLEYRKRGSEDVHTSRIILGTVAIEESICAAIQEIIEEQMPPQHRTAGKLLPVPYRILQKLLEHLAPGIAVTPRSVASLGTLALLTPHPGALAVDFCTNFAKKRKFGISEEEILASIIAWIVGKMKRTMVPLLERDADRLLEIHKGRGLMEKASRYIIGNMLRHLEHRIEAPLFDMDTFFPKFDIDAFVKLQELCPPCDAIQRRSLPDDMVGRDFCVSIGVQTKDDDGYRPTDYLRVQQAQQEYVFAHLDTKNATFIPTRDVQKRPCPYYGHCKLKYRVEQSEICKTSPWLAFSSGREVCQYRAAVNSTIGPVTVEPLRSW